jgi:lipocalin
MFDAVPKLMLMAGLFFRASAIEPLATVDVGAYTGRWYQTWASPSVAYTFQLGGNCVTADYNVTDFDGVVSVLNIVRPLGGEVPIAIDGYAVQNPEVDGALQVALGPGADVNNPREFTSGDGYWIVDVGPINQGGQYDWATVSDSRQATLYVLVRDPVFFASEYEDDVLNTLRDQGFTGPLNQPIKTNQENCKY